MSSQFTILDEYELPCTVPLPGTPEEKEGKWVETTRELNFIAVMKDMAPGEMQSIQEQILSQLQPVFEVLQNLKAKKHDEIVQQATAAETAAKEFAKTKPLLEQKLVRVKGLTVFEPDGKTELDEDATRDFVLRHPRFRAAIEKAHKKLTGEGGASMGNLLKSAVAGHS